LCNQEKLSLLQNCRQHRGWKKSTPSNTQNTFQV
jgi:hypothetical protein